MDDRTRTAVSKFLSFVLSHRPGAIGISNVFGGDEPQLLRALASFAQASHPERSVVGYGPEAELDILAPLGFRDLGPLRVWIT